MSEYNNETQTGDEKALEVLNKIVQNNVLLKSTKIFSLYGEEIKKLQYSLEENENYSTFVKEIIEVQIYCFIELKRKVMEKYSEDKRNFDILKFIKKQKKENKQKIQNEIMFTVKEIFENIKKNNDTVAIVNNSNNNDLYKKIITFGTNNVSLKEYIDKLDNFEKKKYLNNLKNVENIEISNNDKPNVINVLNWNTTDKNKSIVLNMISDFENINRSDSDKSKYKKWIEKIMRVPVGIFMPPKITKTSKPSKITNYLNNIKKSLDENIYGHDMSKNQLIKIIAQTISNPNEGGNIFALQGDPGVGKTELMNAVAKSLDRPFSFCSLGGASDGSYLEGHGFTYVGSCNGKIVDLLVSAKCMNPIIYFDELDKVSETAKGQEIINILMHITDQTQNSHYNDKYFYGFDFDLSKALIIFSFNDTSKVSKILRDRMKIINVKGYDMTDKINIADKYLIPKLIKEIGLDDFNINISNEIITHVVQYYTNESGVRKLKQKLHDVFTEINLRRYTHNLKKITITKELLDNDILKKHNKIKDEIVDMTPKVGTANGLYASDGCMVGGTTLVECCFMPSQHKLDLQLTGSLGDVMQESMKLAKTIAWKVIPTEIKKILNDKWLIYPEGIHIHCPEGATSKDGPSAGGVITLCIISLLTGARINTEYAMTGEITQQGKITAIGGLQQKIFGAKKEGIKHILCPFENKKDLDEIKEKHPDLFNEQFTVETINNIYDILDKVLLDKIDYVKF